MSEVHAKQLVRNGRWAVPPEMRPVNWQKMPVKEPEQELTSDPIQQTTTSKEISRTELVCADLMAQEARRIWAKGSQFLREADHLLQQGDAALRCAKAILDQMKIACPEFAELVAEERRKMESEKDA